MDAQTFETHLTAQQQRSTDILSAKGKEYAGPTDRLHNFKQAAHLQRITQAEALGGMMAKHTVSVYDMIDRGDVTAFTLEQWQEKITDHINYLLLLNAVVEEEHAARADVESNESAMDPDAAEDAKGTFLDPTTIRDLVENPGLAIPEHAHPDSVATVERQRREAIRSLAQTSEQPAYKPTNAEQTLIGKLVNNPNASIPADKPQAFKDAVEYGRRLARESASV